LRLSARPPYWQEKLNYQLQRRFLAVLECRHFVGG
jgi:hypothetical protein